VRIKNPDQSLLAEIDVTFGLRFTSKEPMSDEIFAIFRDTNVPVNIWPYLREYLASTAGRMNWTVLTLPVLKVAVYEAARGAR